MTFWTLAVIASWLVSTSCATPVPRADVQYHRVGPSDLGLIVDLDLLASAELTPEQKRSGEELLILFHSAEESLERYSEALEQNLDANERLSHTYGIADAIVGVLAGFSSTAVIFAKAAIAAPIAGAVWIGVGLTIQNFEIDPKIEQARKQLAEARRLLQLFPDIITAFRGLVFAERQGEAEGRFKQWKAYVENLHKKVLHFFTIAAEQMECASRLFLCLTVQASLH